jgi:hypothetical protein
MDALKRVEAKLPKGVKTSTAIEAGFNVGWLRGKGWISVTDRLPKVGEVVYAYGYVWNVITDRLDGFMHRCHLEDEGLWVYKPSRDDGRDDTKIFESHHIDFWREIPEEEK